MNSLLLADYLIETEPIINKFISVPKDKGVLNCAAFISGIIEAILIESNFVSLSYFWELLFFGPKSGPNKTKNLSFTFFTPTAGQGDRSLA